jgi:hypothetical protein
MTIQIFEMTVHDQILIHEVIKSSLNSGNAGYRPSRWPRGLGHEMSLLARTLDRGFEFHSGYGCQCTFILHVLCVGSDLATG